MTLELLAVDRDTYCRLIDRLAVSWRDLDGLRPWRLVTATSAQDKAGLRPLILGPLVVLIATGLRLESRRVAAAFLLGDWLSSGAPAIARLAGALGNGPALATAYQAQPRSSSAMLAVLAAALAGVTASRRRRRLHRLLLAGLVVRVVLSHRFFDWAHLLAAATGTAVGHATSRRAARRQSRNVEARTDMS